MKGLIGVGVALAILAATGSAGDGTAPGDHTYGGATGPGSARAGGWAPGGGGGALPSMPPRTTATAAQPNEVPAPLRVPAATVLTPAASATSAAPAATAAAATTAARSISALIEEAAASAAALHATIAVQDWALAGPQAIAVRDALARLAEPGLRAPALREEAARLQRLTPLLEQAIARRDAYRANDAAYRTVYGLLDAITDQASARPTGGGGGAAAAPVTPASAPDVPPAVAELRAGYPAAMRAHAALLRGEPARAKAQLDAVRDHLQAALQRQPGAVFGKRLDNLNKARWRVVAALADPLRAQRMSVQLTRAYAEAVHAVGLAATQQTAAQSGGGGGRATLAPARLRAIQRPSREQTRGSEGIPYRKRP